MILRNTSKANTGFTIVEILVVVGILLALISLSLGVGVSTYSRSTFFAERDMVVQLLQSARARAMNNVGELPHGLYVDDNRYVLFQGHAFDKGDPFNEEVGQRPGLEISGVDEVVFKQLSGRFPDEGSIVISNDMQSATITINYEGAILW